MSEPADDEEEKNYNLHACMHPSKVGRVGWYTPFQTGVVWYVLLSIWFHPATTLRSLPSYSFSCTHAPTYFLFQYPCKP